MRVIDYRPMVWPAWVVTEDSEVVWVRRDAGSDALAEARSCVTEPGWTALALVGGVNMTRGIAGVDERAWFAACEWSDEPVLQETDDEHDPQDAVRYLRYEVVEHWEP